MKEFNTTQLYIDRAEERGIVHRDYMAHCLRWTHILKYAKMGQRILDVGCGINTPLLMTFYTNKFRPSFYMGLDLRNKFDTDPIKFPFPVHLKGNFDITNEDQWNELLKQVDPFDIVTCLEVLEHMPKEKGIELLENLAAFTQKNSVIFLSTPCFNGSAAANHIHEWEYGELRDELGKLFRVEAHFGTFASQRDILPFASGAQREVFEQLREYYDPNFLSILLAPLHPAHSRNCIWRLRVL